LKRKLKFIKESKKKRMRIIFEKIINLYYGSKDDIESKLKFDKRSKKLKKKDQSWNIEELMSLTPILFTIIPF